MDRKAESVENYRQLPFGATPVKGGVNFAVWAPNSTGIKIHVFDRDDRELYEISLPERRGGTWYGFVPNLGVGSCYALEALGVEDPSQGFYFKQGRLLVDPYAKLLSKPFTYDENAYLNDSKTFIPKAVIPDLDKFDWQGVPKICTGREKLIIYELNVKGMTVLNSKIPERFRGKYLGLCCKEVISHLKKLGITAVQLNPIAAFMTEPALSKKGLKNYWGYNPICFMAPDPKYATDPFAALDEFRTMVRELHRNDIAVILDVVYNHTAEGGKDGPVLCYKGLDARNYYAYPYDQHGFRRYLEFVNVTGCGNSFNCDNPVGLNLVLDAMNFWLQYAKVDGFRFDLGVTLCRESHGNSFYEFDPNCAFLKCCFCLDTLSSAILIAEPWDIGHDGYRLGMFRLGWSEQNDRFRDTVRRFWRGDRGIIGDFATRLLGSRDIFSKDYRSINASVNFITYHDGFTLEDLVSYNFKHNADNLEGNRDGSDQNFSSNCGIEGPTIDPFIIKKRWQQKRNLMATLLIAQGIPHLLYGDEFSRTQRGNNNAYCQDNEISYLKWDYSDKNEEFIDFIGRLSSIRQSSEMIRELNLEGDRFLHKKYSYIAGWYQPNAEPMTVDKWNDPDTSSVVLVISRNSPEVGEQWCLIFNQGQREILCTLPKTPIGKLWKVLIDTADPRGLPLRNLMDDEMHTVCRVNSLKILILYDDDIGSMGDDLELRMNQNRRSAIPGKRLENMRHR